MKADDPDGRRVGKLTSWANTPDGRSIGLAILRRELAADDALLVAGTDVGVRPSDPPPAD